MISNKLSLSLNCYSIFPRFIITYHRYHAYVFIIYQIIFACLISVSSQYGESSFDHLHKNLSSPLSKNDNKYRLQSLKKEFYLTGGGFEDIVDKISLTYRLQRSRSFKRVSKRNLVWRNGYITHSAGNLNDHDLKRKRKRFSFKIKKKELVLAYADSDNHDLFEYNCFSKRPGSKKRGKDCNLPNCKCQNGDIPNNLPIAKIPQFVMLSFDDAINSENFDTYLNLSRARINPNGCPSQFTFFVSHEWTNYQMVAYLYDMGHEIASHSISHRTPQTWWKEEANYEDWKNEIAGQRQIISDMTNIPKSDIKGMRAPFLQSGGNLQFEMLTNEGFQWDSSFPSPRNEPPLWPYTLHLPPSDCQIPPCLSKGFKKIWEFPMVDFLDDNGNFCSMVDQCLLTSGSPENVFEFLGENFLRHYGSNKAPFPLFMHSAWLTNSEKRKLGFIKFLDTIAKLEDVYLVSVSQTLDWIRHPTTLDNMRPITPNVEEVSKEINAKIIKSSIPNKKMESVPIPNLDKSDGKINSVNSSNKSHTFITVIKRSKRSDDYDFGGIIDHDFETLYPYCNAKYKTPDNLTNCMVKKFTDCYYVGTKLTLNNVQNSPTNNDLLEGSQSTSHYLQSCMLKCPYDYPWMPQRPPVAEQNIKDDYLDFRKRKYYEAQKRPTHYDLLSKILKSKRRQTTTSRPEDITTTIEKRSVEDEKTKREKFTYLLPERIRKKYIGRTGQEEADPTDPLIKYNINLFPSPTQAKWISKHREREEDSTKYRDREEDSTKSYHHAESKVNKKESRNDNKQQTFSNGERNPFRFRKIKKKYSNSRNENPIKREKFYDDRNVERDRESDEEEKERNHETKYNAKCSSEFCKPPGCRCASPDIPSQLEKSKMPQLVLLSFSGAVNELNFPTYLDILGNISNSGEGLNRKKRDEGMPNKLRLNPNGCPISATFFISHEWTNYQMVHDLYNRGHEVALNSISYPDSQWWKDANYDDWVTEIGDQKVLTSKFANISESEIVGVRVPYMETGGDKQFKMLREHDMLYDSSIPTDAINPPLFPYTLEYKSPYVECSVGECPTKSYPGIWEIPLINYIDGKGKLCSTVPACELKDELEDRDYREYKNIDRPTAKKNGPSDSRAKKVFDLLSNNFHAHYESNRAPFPLALYWEWLSPTHEDDWIDGNSKDGEKGDGGDEGGVEEEDWEDDKKKKRAVKRETLKYYNAVERDNNDDDDNRWYSKRGESDDEEERKDSYKRRDISSAKKDKGHKELDAKSNPNLQGLVDFLDMIGTLEDVYIVNHKDTVSWMESPLDSDTLANPTSYFKKYGKGLSGNRKTRLDDPPPGPWMCKRALNYGRNDVADNTADCSVKEYTTCAYDTDKGLKYFFPCGECPKNYPWANNPLGE
ncbi:unnamed protein product [Gordionus sp. m RMFG-2023]